MSARGGPLDVSEQSQDPIELNDLQGEILDDDMVGIEVTETPVKTTKKTTAALSSTSTSNLLKTESASLFFNKLNVFSGDRHISFYQNKRWIMLICALLQVILVGGIIFGWSAMAVLLIDDDVYGGLCDDKQNTTRQFLQQQQPSSSSSSFFFFDTDLSNLYTIFKPFSAISSSFLFSRDTNPVVSAAQADDNEAKKGCDAQNARIQLLFTLGSSAFSFFGLFIGRFIDQFGARLSTVLGTLFVCVSFVLFGYANPYNPGLVDILMAAVLCLAIGCFPIFVSSFQYSSLFPSKKGLVISVTSSCFDGAPVVFTIFMIIHEYLGVSRQMIFTAYLVVPAAMLCIFWLWPNKPIEVLLAEAKAEDAKPSDENDPEVTTDIEASVSQADSITVDVSDDGTIHKEKKKLPLKKVDDLELENHASSMEEIDLDVEKKAENSSESSDSAAVPDDSAPVPIEGAKTQLLSFEWFMIAVFFALTCLQLNFFLGTIDIQLFSLDDDPAHKTAKLYLTLLGFILPAGAFIAPAIYGPIIDNFGVVTALIVVMLGCAGYEAIMLLPWLNWTKLLACGLFSLIRAMAYSGFSAALGFAFGFNNFGLLYGAATTVGATVILLQFPILKLVQIYLHGSFFYVNLAFLVIDILQLSIPISFWVRGKRGIGRFRRS